MPSVDSVGSAYGDPAHSLTSSSAPASKQHHATVDDDSVKPVADELALENEVSLEPVSDPLDEVDDGPPLQMANEDLNGLDPIPDEELDPDSFNLVEPGAANGDSGSMGMDRLEQRSELLFSRRHLQAIFDDSSQLHRFSSFLYQYRPGSIPLFTYYLDALKAIRAIHYSNSILAKLGRLDAFAFTHDGDTQAAQTANRELEAKADAAFEMLAQEDLPMYVTHTWIQVVTQSVRNKIVGTPRHESEGLAEVFCLTDPSRHDNPIVLMSEEFNRTTQYGVDYVIGRNCRFLQGPRTNPFSVKRIRDKLAAGIEHYETFLNYRRDGSSFMNLVMLAPLYDSRGKVRYFIGAQVDVSGLAMNCYNLSALEHLTSEGAIDQEGSDDEAEDECIKLAEILSPHEIDTMRSHGGDMYRLPLERKAKLRTHEKVAAPIVNPDSKPEGAAYRASNADGKSRVVIADPGSPMSPFPSAELQQPPVSAMTSASLTAPSGGRLAGIYEKYLLVRPYPSMRILFCSPAMRVPGILQSPLLERISCSPRAGEQLLQALAAGQAVTAKVRWLTVNHKASAGESLAAGKRRAQNREMNGGEHVEDHAKRTDAAPASTSGRTRWLHCTPLTGSNGKVGVWMVVLVDEDSTPRRPAKPIPIPGPAPRQVTDGGRRTDSRDGASMGETIPEADTRPRLRPRSSSETLGSARRSVSNRVSSPQAQHPIRRSSLSQPAREPPPPPGMVRRSSAAHGVPTTNGFASAPPVPISPATKANDSRRMNIGSMLSSRHRRPNEAVVESHGYSVDSRSNGYGSSPPPSSPGPLMTNPPAYMRKGYHAKVSAGGQYGMGTKSVETFTAEDGSSINTVRIEEP